MTSNLEAKDTTRYWSRRVMHGLPYMRLAEEMGLFPKKEEKEDWRNVQEHELVEAEAADVLAEATGCSRQDRKDLITAGLFHDVGKRLEITLIRQRSDEGQKEAFRIQSQRMKDHGISARAIALTESVGHTSLDKFLQDPKAQNLELRDDLDLPTLIIHYADDITKDSNLVTIDERIDGLENSDYPEKDKGGDIFGGRTYFQVQRIVGHLVENKLAEIIGIEPSQMLDFIRSKISERIRLPRELEKVTIESLQAVFDNHQQLGETGKQVLIENQFGQDTLEADWQAEETVLNHLRKLKIPIRVISEEHGIVDIGEELGMKSQYTGILDGLDGTRVYREGSGRYGTMFTIFQGLDPRYKDYLSCGILEYPSGRILSATHGEGVYLWEGNQKTKVRTARVKDFDPETIRVEVDGGFEGNARFAATRLSEVKQARVADLSAAIYYFDLATAALDMAVVSTRKGNLEMAAAYGIVREAFGVMIDEEGNDLGERKYFEYGQGQGERLIVLSFASRKMAERFKNE